MTDNISIQDLQTKLEELENKVKAQKERQKIAQQKYHQSDKGKAARKRSYQKCYVPTGRPRGRPKLVKA